MNPAGLWNYNLSAIRLLSPAEIARKIWLSPTASNRFQNNFNYSTLLARTRLDENGQLKSAGVMLIRWIAEEKNATYDWEASFLEVLRAAKPIDGVDTLYDAPRSFHDVQEQSILDDMIFFYAGYAMVFTYVITVLGKRNCLEFKAPLAVAGLLSVTMSLAITLGICGAVGIPMFQLLQMVPFLSLGLGIDDMFVIVQCHENIMAEHLRSNPGGYHVEHLALHMGKVMARAGAAISVTSVTDFVAFGISIFTNIPALKWFCQASCISIFSVFVLQATFFPACLLLDIKRQQSNRSALFCCYRMSDKYKPSKCSESRIIDLLFHQFLAKYLTKSPTKVTVLFLSFVALGVNCYGASSLKRSSDELNVIPSDKPPALFNRANRKYFTSNKLGAAYFGEIDYSRDIPKLDQIRRKFLKSNKTMIIKADAWPSDYLDFSNRYNESVCSRVYWKGQRNFGERFRAFVCCKSPQYRRNFMFRKPLSCDPRTPVPKIRASFIEYEHAFTFDPVERSNSIAGTHEVLREVGIESKSGEKQDLIYSTHYGFWEGEETMIDELFRNLILASGFVLLTTLFLIASIPACLLVALSVSMTLVDALGMLYFMGVSLDTISSLLLIAAIGLSVDFSAHIAHTFMTLAGEKNDRARATLIDIGPAVLHGGMTTFLAFSLLFFSKSFVFQVFCKTFLSVVLCGLYHGLIFLPVMLSYFGPAPYPTATPVDTKTSENKPPDVLMGTETFERLEFEPPSHHKREVLMDPKRLAKMTFLLQNGYSEAERMYHQNPVISSEPVSIKKPGRGRKFPPPDYMNDSSCRGTSESSQTYDSSPSDLNEDELPPYLTEDDQQKRPKKQRATKARRNNGTIELEEARKPTKHDSLNSYLTSSALVTASGRSWLHTTPANFWKLKRSSSESTFRSHRNK